MTAAMTPDSIDTSSSSKSSVTTDSSTKDTADSCSTDTTTSESGEDNDEPMGGAEIEEKTEYEGVGQMDDIVRGRRKNFLAEKKVGRKWVREV